METKIDGFLKIIADGRVTLPKEAREHWDLSEGDLLSFELTDEGLLLKPIQFSEKKIDKLKTMALTKGKKTDSAKSAKDLLKG